MVPIFIVVLVGSLATNAVSAVLRPPVYGLGLLVMGLAMWPLARHQSYPRARYLAVDGKLVFGKYLMFWVGVSILLMSIYGAYLFR